MKARSRAVAAVLVLAGACSAGPRGYAPRAPVPGATAGGTLTVAIGRPASIDPAHVYEPWGRLVVSLLCDPLIQIDPVSGDPKPALAESWIVGSGGKQLTIKLRKGVRFSDGRLVTADDVAFSLSRVASEEEASNVAEVLRPVVGWEEMHGDVEPRTPERAISLAGVQVVGTDAVQISLAGPRADFYRALAEPMSAPVPRAAVTKDPSGFEAQPVCAGPYKLERPWRPGDASISLVRFAGYYGRNAGYSRGGRGYADRIELLVREDAGGTRAVGERRADAAMLPWPSRAPAGTTVVSGSSPYLEYVGLPIATPPFDRREVRLALSRALDRAAIARDVYGGVRSPARGFLPRSLGSIARPAACGSTAPAAADAGAAERGLRTAGAELRGTQITLSYNPDFQNRVLAEAVARQWEAALGVRVKLRSVAWGGYLDAATAERGFEGAFRLGWKPRYPGPDAMLAPLFASSSIGRDNFTGFSDTRFDRILDRIARRAGSEEDLRTSYRQLEDILCEQMPAVPVVFGGARAVVRPDRIASAAGSFFDVGSGSLAVRELYVRGPG